MASGRSRTILSFGKFGASSHNTNSVETQIGKQFVAFGVLNELIGNSQSADMGGIHARVGGGFKDGAAETACQCGFLNRHDKSAVADGGEDCRRIEWFDKARTDDTNFDAVFTQFFRGGKAVG